MPAYEPHPVILWELTRACDLHCRGCPSGADERRSTSELTTYEAYKTIDQIAALQPRELVITGGDPLEREDVFQIVDYARRRGLDPALALSPTSHLTFDAMERLERNGLTTVVVGLDGSAEEIHRSVHGIAGTFAATLRAMRWAECARLRIEVNTLVCRQNVDDLEAIVELIRPFQITRWNVHFLVPVGGSAQIQTIAGEEVEGVFARIAAIGEREKFSVRVVEAPHYRRHLLERDLDRMLAGEQSTDDWSQFVDCIRPGASGFVYVSHAGDVRPSEFVPQSAGSLRFRSLGDIYRGSDLFVALRTAENLKGRCGRCDYREICGGSRARSWAATGDIFAADPLCSYEPERRMGAPVIPARNAEV